MSRTNNAILDAQRRALDYWDIDGLPVLIAGISAISYGGFFLWISLDKDRSIWGVTLFYGLWSVFCLWIEKKGNIEWLKGRITYPRTGYVVPPEIPPPASLRYGVNPLIEEPPPAPIALRTSRKAIELTDFPLFFFLVWLFTDNSWLMCLACLWTALLFWKENKQDPPWFEIAGSVIAGVASAILPVSGLRRTGIIILIFGVTSMIKGTILLLRYLRQHPAPQA
jgi:hypothetical protein